ncbi:BA14K family protein [Rhizobium sp.]|uniref:BA14K family protein n=1 Tax=Rhizobium sp. TaxID=391 RepID=UPI002AA86B29
MAKMMRFAVSAIALSVLAGSFGAAQAMPLTPNAPMASATSLVEQVQWRDDGYYGNGGGDGYYRGYRGYDRPRPHYRRHDDGRWYPLAAFAAGALIGGAIASQPGPEPVPRGGNGVNPRHYQWCEGRYRTYDAYSNTFVNYDGERQQCLSPYY